MPRTAAKPKPSTVNHPPITDPINGATLNEAINALGFSTVDYDVERAPYEKNIVKLGKIVFTGDSVACWYWVKLQHLRKGTCLVVSEEFLDWLFTYDQATLSDYALTVRSLPNPERVGILDAYIAWIGAKP